MNSSSDLDRRRVILAGAAAATLGAVLTATTQAAEADQPHMRNALANLRNARNELSVASHNKSGHRENALDLVNRAIGQVEAGIAAGEGY